MSNLGRFQIALGVFASFWGLSAIIDGSYNILLIPHGGVDREGCSVCWDPVCSSAFYALRDSLIHAPILAFPTETGQYILDTDASNFGLGGVLSQMHGNVERVVAYCSRALRPSQRRYCTTKREMLAAVAMCIQFRSYRCDVKFTLRTDHKSLVWLHRFKDTEGIMARWVHALQQFQFSIVCRPGKDHGNATVC